MKNKSFILRIALCSILSGWVAFAIGGGFFMSKVQSIKSEKIIGIYKITSPSQKVYIGQSVDIAKRKRYYSCLHCKGQPKLYESLNKYGWDAHTFEIIKECSREELNDLEATYIKLYNSFNSTLGMNLESGGKCKLQSDETKKKRSESLKGRVFTQEWKDKIGEKSKGRMIGFKFSEEVLAKLRVPKPHMRGREPVNKGRGMSKEQARINHNLANKKYRASKKI